MTSIGMQITTQCESAFDVKILRLGMIGVALVFLQAETFGSDGFIIGKTPVLIFASMSAIFCHLTTARDLTWDKSDWLLLVAVALLCASCLNATNVWGAWIAGGGVVSSIALFWVTRSISQSSNRAALLAAVALVLALVVSTCLIEAYSPIQFSSRPPGGTIGNRNRAAHLVVLAFPALSLIVLRVRSRWALGAALLVVSLCSMVLVLSRARGAWVAALATAIVACTIALWVQTKAAHGWSFGRTSQRLTILGVVASIGAFLALRLPNDLTWATPTPYRDSARTLFEFRSGTGAGRLTEYRNTLSMIADHYVIGVGPGNWRIEYPRYSSPGDPNIETGYIPVRRFPQGEWIGTAAERGIPSILVIVGIGVVLVTRWFEAAFRSRSRRRTQYAYVGILTLTALVTIGLFDPVIMTPTAGFVVPVLLGVCAGPFARMRRCAPTPLVRRTLLIGIGLVGVFLLNFQIRDVVGALVYSNAQSSAGFVQAARIAPGDFSARFLAANALARIGDCTRATPHIEAAMQLYPTAPAIQNLIRLCPSNPSL